MNNSKLAAKNSLIGLGSQLVALAFQFITRSILVHYLGVSLLGVSSVFNSVLHTLCLAELGFQSAIVYQLYQPLHEKDEERINRIVNVFRTIYQAIGLFVLVGGLLCTPFLKYILKGISLDRTIYLIFFVQLANSASSYFLAYRRALLYADKREFMTKLVDTAMNFIFSILKIIVVVKWSNYVLYISLLTLQTVSSNLIIHLLSRSIYPYLHKTKFDRTIFISIWGNVKNVFVGKIASYIYNATDSLVVSVMVNTVAVGFMVNYTTVISSLKTLSRSILHPITPIIGGMLAANADVAHRENIFNIYTFIRYLYACAVVIPMTVLMQSFIAVWVGEDYLLSFAIVILYGIDLYIHLVHSSLCDFINGNGLFRQDRNTEIAGALSNIVTSIVLARFLGISGVLIGTVVSQSLFWVCRSIIVYRHCFGGTGEKLAWYWVRMAEYIVVFVGLTALCMLVYSYIHLPSFLLRFIVGGIACEGISGGILLLLFHNSKEFRGMLEIVKKILKREKKSKA